MTARRGWAGVIEDEAAEDDAAALVTSMASFDVAEVGLVELMQLVGVVTSLGF